MRRLICWLTAGLAALTVCGAASAADTFTFSGHGYGHGVGMPQYGAQGYAQHGAGYAEILAHYFPGTTLGPAPKTTIRVLLASGKTSVTVSSDGPITLTGGDGASVALPAGTPVTLGPDLVVGGRAIAPPVRLRPGGKPLVFGKRYRGSLVVDVNDKGTLSVVNVVGLEKYLYGVVPGEMAASWEPEALKAQAVAARSYALASRRTTGSFDVFADTRSQVYGGIGVEDRRTTAAVNATKGRVVLFQGKVASTFFSSSSGGRTAAVEDGFPGAQPIPYLVSVDDPYDTISPYHDWGPVTFTKDQLEARLGGRLPDGFQSLAVELNPSGRVSTVVATGTGGETRIPGTTVRFALGLRSTWFTIESLALDPSARRIEYGQHVKLKGRVARAGRVVLDARPAGEEWQELASVRVGRRGAFSFVDRPHATTAYRVHVGARRGPPVVVAVAPALRLRSAASAALSGTVKPRLAGVTVTVERRASQGWRPVGSGRVGTRGRFRIPLELRPGVYRARMPRTAALSAGVSPQLRVPSG